jgi:hypothetical protein
VLNAFFALRGVAPVYGELPPEKDRSGPARRSSTAPASPPTTENPVVQQPGPDPDGDDNGGLIGTIIKGAKKAMKAFCAVMPDGRVTNATIALGGIGVGTFSFEQVVNYKTGEVSFFNAAGLQGGWNGALSVGASTGPIYGNLGDGNVNYKGWFYTVQGSVRGVGGGYSTGGDIHTATVGVSGGFAKGTLTGGRIVYDNPTPLGSVFAGGNHPVDQYLTIAKQFCNNE